MEQFKDRTQLRQFTKEFAQAAMLVFICGACSDARLKAVTPIPGQKTVSLSVHNYCPEDGFQLGLTFAHNASTLLENGVWLQDWDRDGLSDNYERAPAEISTFNIFWRLADNNGDGLDDLWVVRNNILSGSIVMSQPCTGSGLQDSDLDGLNGCTERLMRTESDVFDSDGDSIPDGLEFRFGLNPSDGLDGGLDPDDDGLTNLQELQRNTPVSTTNSELMQARALQYSTVTSSNEGTTCYHLRVENIPVMPVENGNLVQLFVTESQPNQPRPNGSIPQQLRTVDILLLDDVLDKATIKIVADTHLKPQFPNVIGNSDLNPVVFE